MEVFQYENMPLLEQLRGKLWRLLLDVTEATRSDSLLFPSANSGSMIEMLAAMLEEDLLHFARVDPAAHGDPKLILDAYSSFSVILHYRLAHAIYTEGDQTLDRQRAARWLTEKGKIESGVDIHPAAKIGKRFVLDHAMGTVIGETSEIGDDCYILGGVVLGARGISKNPSGKRHPKIGNHVQIGAFARVLGPVTVGDNAFIASNCVITSDIPPNGKACILNQIQVEKHNGPSNTNGSFQVLGAGVVGQDLMVMGSGFHNPFTEILDVNFQPCDEVTTNTELIDSLILKISLFHSGFSKQKCPAKMHVRIKDGNNQITIIEPLGIEGIVIRQPTRATQCA